MENKIIVQGLSETEYSLKFPNKGETQTSYFKISSTEKEGIYKIKTDILKILPRDEYIGMDFSHLSFAGKERTINIMDNYVNAFAKKLSKTTGLEIMAYCPLH